MSAKAEELLGRVLLDAADLFPYLSRGLAAMSPIERPGLGTVGVDRAWRLYYDPKVLCEWAPAQAATIIALHELAGHLLRDHASRAEAIHADPKTWNTAADAEINDDLPEADLPGSPVLPSRLGFSDGLLAEEYYRLLSDSAPSHPGGSEGHGDRPQRCGSGSGGEALPGELEGEDGGAPGLDRAAAEALRDAVAADIRGHESSAPGSVPAGLRVWADARAVRPRTDWRSLLRSAVARAAREYSRGRADYTYSRVRRRQVPGVILPGQHSPRPTVGVIVDTSKSMSALGPKVLGILAALTAAHKIKAWECDAVCSRVPPARLRRLAFRGGGGTDLRPAIAQADRECDLLVVISDCTTPWPKSPTRHQMVVAALGKSASPHWANRVEVDAAP